MAIRFGNGFGVGASNGGGGSSLSFFTNITTITTYLKGYMSDFRNPDFYSYVLDGDGHYIYDGDNDMFDTGNFTTPWLISNVTYSGSSSNQNDYPHSVDYQTNGTGTLDTSFGYTSLGFSSPNFLPLTVIGTRATIASPGTPIGFQCGGNSGADGSGSHVEGNIYTGDTVSGFTVHAYYSETYDAGDPSTCSVFILLGHPNWNSVFGDVFYGGDSDTNGNGAFLYTSGGGTQNILAIKTLLSKDNGVEVTFSEVNAVVDNFIMRIGESQVSPTPTPTASVTPTPTPSSTPAAVCNSNYVVTDGGTTHVYDGEPGTLWNGYDGNYLQVGPSQGGPAPDAGWYFVDECGTIRQLLNDTLWFSGGSPSPFPNGTGWLCVADGPFILTSGTTSLTLYETIPTVTFTTTPTPTPTSTEVPTGTPTPTPTATPIITQSSAGATPTTTPTSTGTPTPTPTGTPTLTPSSTSTPTGYTINIYESGPNVVWSGSGTLNLNDLTYNGTQTSGPGYSIENALFGIGPNGPLTVDLYTGTTLSKPSNLGPGGGGGGAPSGSGDYFGIFDLTGTLNVAVPTGYTSGTFITQTTTYTGQTFSSIGLTQGTYTYSWGTGANAQTVNVVVGVQPNVTPTPTPSVGSNMGAGWYFYTPFGNNVSAPPLSNGQSLFYTAAGGPPVSKGSPNSDGNTLLMFYKNDSAGTSYETQFGNLMATGGTINVTQNSQTATYTSNIGNAFFLDNGGFLVFNAALQTATVASAFTYTDKITLTFS